MQVRTVLPRALAQLVEATRHLARVSRIRSIGGRSAAGAALTLFVLSDRRLGSSSLSGLPLIMFIFALVAQLARARLERNAETTS